MTCEDCFRYCDGGLNCDCECHDIDDNDEDETLEFFCVPPYYSKQGYTIV